MATATPELVLGETQSSTRAWALPRVVPELDGVRGVAIVMVLLCHASMFGSSWQVVLEHGRSGVDLFFVLSGFLITGILLDTRDDRRRVRNFYIRRGLRIWPLYFVYLAVAFVVFRFMLPERTYLWVYYLFAQNLFFWSGAGPFLEPTWSLAVEEQFYLVWPWIAFRAKRETVIKIGCAVLAVSPIMRLIYRTAFTNPEVAYVNTFCRLDGMAMGAILAAWVREPDFDGRKLRRFGLPAVWIGGIGAVVTLCFGRVLVCHEISYSFLVMAFGGVVALSLYWHGQEQAFAKFFRQRWIAWIGKVSFALYLFNFPIYTLAHGNHMMAALASTGLRGWQGEAVIIVVENVALFVAAWVSWNVLERRMLRLKAKWAGR